MITIEHQPSAAKLEVMGVYEWPIWTKEVSAFPWNYEGNETCYFLEGDVIVTPEGKPPIHLTKGDLVTFSKGLSCTWEIRQPVKKHYRLGSTT